MAHGRSFESYVSDRFYSKLFEAVSSFLEGNSHKINTASRLVRKIDKVVLSDIHVKHTFIEDGPEMTISFAVLLEADYEIAENDRRNDRYDDETQWFKVSCTGDLSQNLDDFAITGVEEYINKGIQLSPMSDELVPIIRKTDLEKHARRFLEQYYPEALLWPHPIDPRALAAKMGLTVLDESITPDLTVFGQLFFTDGDAELYDNESSEYNRIPVSRGTVVVDPKAYFLRNIGNVNNTIVHECVHWALHKKAYELERLFNASASQIRCQTSSGMDKNWLRSDTNWMEWQANSLAPRILMPYDQALKKAAEIIKGYIDQQPEVCLIEFMEAVIDDMAAFFGVSRTAAKIRMVELGYDEAAGTYIYIDSRYVKPHSFKRGILAPNQTFSIGAQDAAIERMTNLELRSLTENGDYLYVDSHFVYNTPQYVAYNANGELELTDYARYNMDECCLVFDLSIQGGIRDNYHTVCFLNREQSNFTFIPSFHNGFQNATPDRQIAMRQKYLSEAMKIRKQMTDDPEQCMKLLLDWRGMKYTDLGDAIDRDPETISRTVKGKTKPQVETAALICFGMNLPPVISQKLMEVLGCKLNPINTEHQWINEALALKYMESIESVRDYLGMFKVII